MGLSLYAKCERSADCFFGGYCNFARCVPILDLGAICNTHEACGRQALCLYSDSLSAFGLCTELLSVDADTLIMGKTKSGKFSKLNLSLFLQHINRISTRCADPSGRDLRTALVGRLSSRKMLGSLVLQTRIALPQIRTPSPSAAVASLRRASSIVTSKEETLYGSKQPNL
jgi:hypothetical protein